MATGVLSPTSLAVANNAVWASSGTIGHLILLSGTLFTGATPVNASTDILTSSTAHGFRTGSRVRLTTTGTLPALSSGSLSTSVDYFVIEDTSTTFKLASTLALAIAGTALNFTDTGSGTLTTTERQLVATDPISVLIAKELSHASYVRTPITGKVAEVVGVLAQQAATAVSYTPSGTDMVFRHSLFVRGSNSTIGNTTGDMVILGTETSDVTIAVGTTKVLLLTLKAENK